MSEQLSVLQERFVRYQPNPARLKTSDCAIRALCKAYNLDWLTAFDELTYLARELYVMPNDIEVIKSYIEARPYKKINVMVKVMGKRKRLSVKEVALMNGTFIIQVANHIVCVKDNAYHDLWNSGNKKAYRIWKVSDE